MKYGDFPKLTSFKGATAFRAHLLALGLDMPCDEELVVGPDSPLAQPVEVDGMRIGNSFATQPMEGWDCSATGAPTENTVRRWERFGQTGAKLIYGGEAAAVRHDGRANPRQLMINEANKAGIAELLDTARKAHITTTGSDDGWVAGLQLTHSGRFCKPNDNTKFEQMILYRHPILDRKFGVAADHPLLSDDDIWRLIDDYVAAARIAEDVGFDFVGLKHCHGYLGHEFLSAKTRPGAFGGSFENRTRFLRELAAGIRAACPRLKLATRVSAVDLVGFKPDPEGGSDGVLGPGVPEEFPADTPYEYGFGTDPGDPTRFELTEALEFLDVLDELGIRLVNITLGSPYYNPHLTRPAAYPPSDGYSSPEDPLLGVMRHLNVVRELKAARPGFCLIGSGYSYLQEFLPFVAQAVLREGWTDMVAVGRMILSYPECLLDALEGRKAQRKKICRSFSDCTTAPRAGMVSGCYPLDPFYKKSKEFAILAEVKKAANVS